LARVERLSSRCRKTPALPSPSTRPTVWALCRYQAPNKESIDAAVAKIKAIVAVPEVGEVYEGTVKSIMPYGCFVEILPGKEGLLHISEIDWKRLETVEEAGIKEGDKIKVKLLEIDPKTGKYKLSHRVLIDKPEGYVRA
jgi:polyribonucleotide nucleotidyltransferase